MGKTKRVADGEETAIAVPPVAAIVQVQLAPGIVLAEIRHAATAIAVDPELL